MAYFILQLIAFSLIPLVGVVFWGWDWRQIIILYWFGNISNGILAYIDLWRADTAAEDFRNAQRILKNRIRLDYSVPYSESEILATANTLKMYSLIFFPIHYGIFTMIHGVFVFFLTLGGLAPLIGATESAKPVGIIGLMVVWVIGLAIAIFLRMVLHAPKKSREKIMRTVYSRIVVLHLVILGGAFIIMQYNLPAIAAVALIGFNTIADLVNFQKDRKGEGGISSETY